MHSITTAAGTTVTLECISCAIARKEIEVLGGIIAETKHLTLANDLEDPISGFLIIATKRHVRSIADLTPEENSELVDLITRARKALQDVLGIQQITIIQEEKGLDSHFHPWLFPWHEWMKEIGSGLGSIPAIKKYAKENHSIEEVRQRITVESAKLREALK